MNETKARSVSIRRGGNVHTKFVRLTNSMRYIYPSSEYSYVPG